MIAIRPGKAAKVDKDFFQRKMTTRFNSIDHDRDGVISKADFEKMSGDVLNRFGLTPESPEGKKLSHGAERYWNNLAEAADVNSDSQITPQEFQRAVTESMLGTADGFTQTAQPWYEAIAEAADTDSDGKLNADEYHRMMTALGATEDAVKKTSPHLTAADGTISVNAVITSIEAFYTGVEPGHPAAHSFGRF
ncbi:EF-hand domain-containing protein [Streptomyces sp. NPDC091371]|uniref:EF-hand domain-containing protein n=1 Tax=Streptomyces sp. NPDC091371 TaxID=3155303 RepID=UPI00342A7C53